MKIINYFLLSLFIIGNLSCSSDDDGGDSFDIIGKWSITEGSIDQTSIVLDIGGMDVPVDISGAFIDIDENNSLTFKEDNTFTSYAGNMSLELDIVVMGTSQTERIEMSDVFGEGTWEVNGRELKIHNSNGATVPYHIDNLNANILELSANVRDLTPAGGSNPMLESMDITVKMKLKRV